MTILDWAIVAFTIAFAGEADMGGAKKEAGRCLSIAGVVVRTASDNDFSAVPKALLGEFEFLEIVQPDRAWNRALSVTQLEIGLGFTATETGDLAEQRYTRAAAHLLSELSRVTPNRERSG